MAVDPNTDPFAASGGGVKLASGGWVPKNHPAAQQAGATSPSAPASSPTAPAPPTNTQQVLNQQVAPGPQKTVTGAFQESLLNKLNAPPASANSAEIQPALAANRLAEQRGYERNRALLAERAAATGTNQSGGFETGLLGLAQDRAAREGQFAGQAVQNLGQQQRQESAQALGLAGGLLGSQLDADLRREGLSAQTSLGQGDLALRDKLGTGNLNLGLLGLLQSGDHFGKSLSADLGKFGASLNQQALLSLLGGL